MLSPNRLMPLAVAGLLCNSLVWGMSWIAFRGLGAQGIHPLWATAGIYAVSLAVLVASRPGAFLEVLRTPALWWIVMASGLNNACFNTAVAIGDVVRVVLLFYLMPVWAMLLAAVLLNEAVTPRTLARVALGLAGAMLVLYQSDAGVPVPRTLAEVLGLAGGALFALNNVLLRKLSQASEAARATAMFTGGTLLAACVGGALALSGAIAWPTGAGLGALGTLAVWSALFLVANIGLQIGASRLPANVTSVIMLTEVLVAAGSAWLAGAAELRLQDIAGGALIIATPWLIRDVPTTAARPA